MKKPKILIFSGYGLNCEEETKHAFDLAGGESYIIHINDLIDNPTQLYRYQMLAIPGGFAYGDDTGSGNAYAKKLKNHLWDELQKFLEKDKLVIGICNGFQILVNLGIFGKVALLHNDSARYTVRWVDLKIENKTPWFFGIKEIFLPIAHGEGKFYSTAKVLNKLQSNISIAARYFKGIICSHHDLSANPSGALDNIAAITDKTGRILGLMPHPERAIYFTQLPHWPYLKEQYLRENRKIPLFGPGYKIFQNAVRYYN